MGGMCACDGRDVRSSFGSDSTAAFEAVEPGSNRSPNARGRGGAGVLDDHIAPGPQGRDGGCRCWRLHERWAGLGQR